MGLWVLRTKRLPGPKSENCAVQLQAVPFRFYVIFLSAVAQALRERCASAARALRKSLCKSRCASSRCASRNCIASSCTRSRCARHAVQAAAAHVAARALAVPASARSRCTSCELSRLFRLQSSSSCFREPYQSEDEVSPGWAGGDLDARRSAARKGKRSLGASQG